VLLRVSSGARYQEDCAEEFLGDPAIAPVIRNAISSHSYWSDTGEPPDDRLVLPPSSVTTLVSES